MQYHRMPYRSAWCNAIATGKHAAAVAELRIGCEIFVMNAYKMAWFTIVISVILTTILLIVCEGRLLVLLVFVGLNPRFQMKQPCFLLNFWQWICSRFPLALFIQAMAFRTCNSGTKLMIKLLYCKFFNTKVFFLPIMLLLTVYPLMGRLYFDVTCLSFMYPVARTDLIAWDVST